MSATVPGGRPQPGASTLVTYLELVRAGRTVGVTDRGKTVARIVPAADDRYAQLVAAGVIRPARRPSDPAHLPEPEVNRTGRPSDEWLAELREG